MAFKKTCAKQRTQSGPCSWLGPPCQIDGSRRGAAHGRAASIDRPVRPLATQPNNARWRRALSRPSTAAFFKPAKKKKKEKQYSLSGERRKKAHRQHRRLSSRFGRVEKRSYFVDHGCCPAQANRKLRPPRAADDARHAVSKLAFSEHVNRPLRQTTRVIENPTQTAAASIAIGERFWRLRLLMIGYN